MPIDIDVISEIAREAGRAIMEIYQGRIEVEMKDDRSPLTAADKAAHRVIVDGLTRHTPEIPILSEEGREIPYAERRRWPRFWLVDPLDGTKEFIKRNGEFTVNIALIEKQQPVMGVVYVPARDMLYTGLRGGGAFLRQGKEAPVAIGVRKADPEKGLTVVVSRSHPSPELDAYLKSINIADAVSVGSSLKLCAIAEGKADLYPRLGPTMEWDTAAGQAVVESGGGRVETREGAPLLYNKENLLNPHFIVSGAAAS